MNPALISVLLTALQNVPQIIDAAKAIKSELSDSDQAAVDAALSAIAAKGNSDIDRAETDLRVAGAS